MSRHWDASNIADQTGKFAIVTGANTGLGKETARVLASKGANVTLAVRNTESGERAATDIRAAHPKALVAVARLDLSSLESIRQFAETYGAEHDQLHYLVNNAGVMVPPYGKTEDGFELQFGTNHLGHFALTGRLLPLLKATSGSRITTVSSASHNFGNIDFDDLAWENRPYRPNHAYGDSKIANLYFTYELARRLNGDGVTVTAAHPGWTATDLQRHSGLFRFFNPILAQKIPMGALPTLRAAVDPDAEGGSYFGPGGMGGIRGYPVKVQSNELSRDESIARRLWDVSEKLTGVTF